MTHTDDRKHRSILQGIARRVMLERGLLPDFPPQALAELEEVNGPAIRTGLDESLRLQDQVAQKLKILRHENGALNLETIAGVVAGARCLEQSPHPTAAAVVLTYPVSCKKMEGVFGTPR